jgi:hypothetical protein
MACQQDFTIRNGLAGVYSQRPDNPRGRAVIDRKHKA